MSVAYGSCAAAIAAAVLAACSAPAAPPEAALERLRFTLEGRAMSLAAPAGAAAKEAPSGLIVFIELQPGRRYSPAIVLSAGPPAKPRAYDRATSWPGGALDYRIERVEGGMGGPEAHLDGRLAAGGAEVAVSCLVQGESLARAEAALFCLAYLKTLEVTP